MKIGIDGTPLAFPHHCGVKHYSEELIKALAVLDGKNEYLIFSPKKVRIPKKRNFRLVLFPSFLPVFKRQISLGYLARKERVDIFHYLEPFGSVFFRHPRIVTTIHDVDLDITYPKNKSLKYLLKRYYCGFTRLAVAKHSERFITVSNSVSKEFGSYLTKIKKKAMIETIYEASAAEFRVIGGKEKSKENFFLCMGDFSPRKNIKKIFAAFDLLPESIKNKYRLKIVTSTPETAHNFTRRRVDVLINPPNKKLVALYNSAAAFLYPSLYEGFGLPILEAMACGCPVVTSNRGSTKEIAGNSALLVNPASPKAISNAMQKIIKFPKFRKNLIQKGLKRAKVFSWEMAARKTLELYNEIYKK